VRFVRGANETVRCDLCVDGEGGQDDQDEQAGEMTASAHGHVDQPLSVSK
jgi:hypothetical protein